MVGYDDVEGKGGSIQMHSNEWIQSFGIILGIGWMFGYLKVLDLAINDKVV